ncbi:hypothetical protein BIFAD42_13720 [Bifidobacterium adolescentis]|uniref:Uncharacterized protein n=1 Tax=Bifidobacterium adolescentis TaxID=1680 RepID=A0AAN4VMC5_BIFAD|nr:hypothetical protein BIFAD42_13720 [Bifidobacterium adolescentis]
MIPINQPKVAVGSMSCRGDSDLAGPDAPIYEGGSAVCVAGPPSYIRTAQCPARQTHKAAGAPIPGIALIRATVYDVVRNNRCRGAVRRNGVA